MRVTRRESPCSVIALAAAVWLLGSAPAIAQSSRIGDMSLEELLNVRVTTATRTSERARDVPARIEVITAEQIVQRGYRSLTDALADLPDFKIERHADQDLPVDVVVQGMRGALRLIVLLDGIRITSPTGEPLPLLGNFPVHTARQIEVLYGPASALYGADAFSAVVNIISKNPDEAEGVRITQSLGQFGLTNTAASYGVRFNRHTRLLVATQVMSDQQPDMSKYYPADFGAFDAQRRGTFNTIFGPITPSGPVPADFANPQTAHSLQATLHAGGLQVLLFDSHSTAPTAPAYTPENAVYSNEAFTRNELLVAAANFTRRIGGVTSTSTFSFGRHELDPQSGYRNVYSNMDRSFKYAYGTALRAEQQAVWKIGGSATITAGGAAERFFAIPQGADLNQPVRSRDEPGTILGTTIRDDFYKIRYQNYAGYLQAQQVVNPSLTLTLGARGDHNTRYGGTFNPRLGLVWQPNAASNVKVLYGSAFLAPSPFQQYLHYGSFYSVDGGESYASEFWHLPNPDLRPQRRSTTEIAARQSFGANVELWGSAFYSNLSDLIRESVDREDRYAGTYKGWPVSLIEVSVNEGRGHTYGGSMGVDLQRLLGADRQITGRVSLSLAEGRIINGEDEVEIGGMAPVQMQMSADLKLDQWNVSPRLTLVGVQRALAVAADQHGVWRRRTLDGFALVNVNVRRRLRRGLDAFVTIENALDARYRSINLRAFNNPEEFIGAPQNPRRIIAGVQVRVQ